MHRQRVAFLVALVDVRILVVEAVTEAAIQVVKKVVKVVVQMDVLVHVLIQNHLFVDNNIYIMEVGGGFYYLMLNFKNKYDS